MTTWKAFSIWMTACFLAACVDTGGETRNQEEPPEGEAQFVVNPDRYTAAPNSDGQILPVLENDVDDGDGQPTVISITQGREGGSVRLIAGAVEYTPPRDVVQITDSFTYTAQSSTGKQDFATVRVDIQGAFPAPQDDTFEVPANSDAQELPVLDNDDAQTDDGELTITGFGATSNGGTVTLENNQISYQPPAGISNSSDTFSYEVKNSFGAKQSATVTVNIGSVAPTAVQDFASSDANGGEISINVLVNDSANTSGGLTIVAVGVASAGGSVSFTEDLVSYQPAPNVSNTQETFTYTIENKDGERDSAQVTVTIAKATPDAVDDSYSVAPDSGERTLTVTENDKANTAGALTLALLTTPDKGGSATVDGVTVKYTPPAGVADVVESFTYRITNADGETGDATVRVNVSAGDPPSPVDDNYMVLPNSDEVQLSVLDNDEPAAERDSFVITALGNCAANCDGQPRIAGDGKSVFFKPEAGKSGVSASFTYSIENNLGLVGTATVTVDIETNDPPSVDDFELTINKNSPRNILDLLAGAMDPDGDDITLVQLGLAEGSPGRLELTEDGQAIYHPAVNTVGPANFNFSISDGLNQVTASGTITVNDFRPDQQQYRPCEAERADRIADDRPYCFDVLMPSGFDGHTIAATVYIPHGISAADPRPVVLHAHGFGESRFASLENPNFVMEYRVTAQSMLELWHEGYIGVTYDQRGFNASGMWGNTAESANSTGEVCTQDGDPACIDVLNPRREGRDLTVVIDWIRDNLKEGLVPADGEGIETAGTGGTLYRSDEPGDPIIGTIGLSYGGGYQTIGSSVDGTRNQGTVNDTRINAMVPVTTWYDLRYSLFPNDVPKSGWIQFLTAATQAGGTTLAPNGFLAGVGQEALVLDNISAETYSGLYQRSVRSYCDGKGNDSYHDGNEPTPADLVPVQGAGEIPGSNDSSDGPDVFIIQAQRDLLFNFNEAYDMAQCYQQRNPNADVRFLSQTEGHILAGVQPASYKDAQTPTEEAPQIIYMDEVVHCDGETLLTRTLISGWMRDKLGTVDDEALPVGLDFTPGNLATDPKVCVTQFVSGGGPVTGVTYNTLDDLPFGGDEGSVTASIDANFNVPFSQGVTPDADGNLAPPAPLVTVPIDLPAGKTLVSGIPTLQLQITANGPPEDPTGAAPIDPPRFFVALTVVRADGTTRDIIAEQILPISGPKPVFDIATCSPGSPSPPTPPSCPVEYSYPRDDGKGQIHGEAEGRLIGVSTIIEADEKLELAIYDQAPLFNLHGTNPGFYVIQVTGSVAVPIAAVSE